MPTQPRSAAALPPSSRCSSYTRHARACRFAGLKSSPCRLAESHPTQGRSVLATKQQGSQFNILNKSAMSLQIEKVTRRLHGPTAGMAGTGVDAGALKGSGSPMLPGSHPPLRLSTSCAMIRPSKMPLHGQTHRFLRLATSTAACLMGAWQTGLHGLRLPSVGKIACQ